MLPGLGLIWSKKEHQLTLEDLHTALNMVTCFIFLFITSNVITLGIAMIPTAITQKADGWCESDSLLPGLSGFSNFMAMLSSFFGMAGFSIIASAAEMAEDTRLHHSGTNSNVHVKEKAGAANIYMTLPLLVPILECIPMGVRNPGIPVRIPKSGDWTANGTWSSTGTTIVCPVYDQQTCAHVIYSAIVLVAMAYEACFNFRYYPPGDSTATDLVNCFGDDAEADQSDDDDDDDGKE